MHSVISANEIGLQLDSTLQELPMWSVYLELDQPAQELATLFEQEPFLPGVILTQNQQYEGMIAKRLFFEQMSHTYGLGLFAGRPVQSLYEFLKPQVSVVTEETTIIEATQIALKRSPEYAYDPIVIKTASLKYGLIDFHELLIAYSQIQILILNLLQQTQEALKISKDNYLELQHKYARLLKLSIKSHLSQQNGDTN
jgi:hypothetical protein